MSLLFVLIVSGVSAAPPGSCLLQAGARLRSSSGDGERAVAVATLGGLADSMREGFGDSLAAINDVQDVKAAVDSVREISAKLVLNNATEHMTDAEQKTIQAVIDIIRKKLYASMNSSHTAEQDELDGALAQVKACNDTMQDSLADAGVVGALLAATRGFQASLHQLSAERDALTDFRDEKHHDLTTFMSKVPAAPVSSCGTLPSLEIETWDVYFGSNDFDAWYTEQKNSYAGKRSAHKKAEADTAAKSADLVVVETQLRTEYCAFSLALGNACNSHDTCYEMEAAKFQETKSRVQDAMDDRIAAFTGGEAAITQLEFLIGTVASPDPGVANASQYQLSLPDLPAKGTCEVQQPVWEAHLASACGADEDGNGDDGDGGPAPTCTYNPKRDFRDINDNCISGGTYTSGQSGLWMDWKEDIRHFHGHSQGIGCIEFTLQSDSKVRAHYGRSAIWEKDCRCAFIANAHREGEQVKGDILDEIWKAEPGWVWHDFESDVLERGSKIMLCEGIEHETCGLLVEEITITQQR